MSRVWHDFTQVADMAHEIWFIRNASSQLFANARAQQVAMTDVSPSPQLPVAYRGEGGGGESLRAALPKGGGHLERGQEKMHVK